MLKFYLIKIATTQLLKFQFVVIGILLSVIPLKGFADNSIPKSDTHFPKIELISPGKHFEVLPGESLKVNALLSDNMELDSYTIKITKGGATSSVFDQAFSIHESLDAQGQPLPVISGLKSIELKFDVEVKDSAVIGDYLFSFLVKDKAGNTHTIKRYIYVGRP